ncbi:MAG: MoxR family ATPase [Proteobacteria bacterium]|nr:MoxR family ATPase [Pseudomonadota bacterium]
MERDIGRVVAEFREKIAVLREEIGQMIVGQRDIIDGVILCLLADGQVLLEGVPGLGKTMLVRTLAAALDCRFGRVQFTPDLMPSDIIGTNMIVEDERGNKRFEFQKGPVFTNILLADEINRATPKTQAALLEAMQEKSVTVGSTTYRLEAPFFVMATQNPLEMEGTYPLPEAQLDRFLFKLNVPFPTKEDLHEILRRTTSGHEPKIRAVMTREEILSLRSLVAEVPIADHVQGYALRIMLGTHPEMGKPTKQVKQYVRFGSSPRGAQAIIKAAKIRAISEGRFSVSNEDVRFAALPALRHRIILNFEGEAEGIRTDAIIEDLIRQTPETEAR